MSDKVIFDTLAQDNAVYELIQASKAVLEQLEAGEVKQKLISSIKAFDDTVILTSWN